MRKIGILLAVLAGCVTHLNAQTLGALSGFCNQGGTHATTSGLSSTNYQQGLIPSCTITVYLAGTTTKATIYKDGSSTPLDNPFTANAVGAAAPGQWTLFAAVNTGLDVIGSGGISPNTYATPVTLCRDCFPSAQVTTPVVGIPLSTNGTANADQTYLDLDNGSGVQVTNTSGGHVSFAVNPATLNPPQYQTAAANLTHNVPTVSVTLPSVIAGARLIAYTNSLTYSCLPSSGQPYYPTLSDTQGNIWTTDASAFSSYIGGNSGSNIIVADAIISASGSITITMNQPAPGAGACSDEYLMVAEFQSVVGVDVTGLQACSLGCSGALAPSATAVAQNNELAVVLGEAADSPTTVATPGAEVFSDPSQTWAHIWQFAALNVGNPTTSTITGYSQNFPGAAIILLKSSLTFGNMSNPMYGTWQMIYSSDTNGSPAALLPGTAGFVLQTNGTSAPTWVTQNIVFVPSNPTGACSNGVPGEIVTSTGQLFTCQGGTWALVGGGSGGIGSIAWSMPAWLSASPGTISASGTQTFAGATGQTAHQVVGTCGTATTVGLCTLVAGDIPAISLSTGVTGSLPLTSLATQAADTVVMNATAGVAVPTAVAMPACTGSTNADIYDTTTHAWACNAITGGGGGTSTVEVNGSAGLPTANLVDTAGAGGIAVTNPGAGSTVNFTLIHTSTAVNGQNCALNGTCDVNTGAAAHSVALNEGAGVALSAATIGTAGRILVDQGAAADPLFKAVSGDCTLTSAGAITCTKTNGTAFSGLATLAGATAGDVAYYNGSIWTKLSGNATGNANLIESASGVPSFARRTAYCVIPVGGTGTGNALQSGDDTPYINACYNDSGAAYTIAAVTCFTDSGSNTTTINPQMGSAGTGTVILSGALTCGSSRVPSASGTISNATWATSTGLSIQMGGTLTGTVLTVRVKYFY